MIQLELNLFKLLYITSLRSKHAKDMLRTPASQATALHFFNLDNSTQLLLQYCHGLQNANVICVLIKCYVNTIDKKIQVLMPNMYMFIVSKTGTN